LGTGIWPTQHFDGKTLTFLSVNPPKELASITLRTDQNRGPALSVRDRLQFCDRGRYLLAFEDPENVSVFDAQNFKLHTTISLRESEEAIRAELLKTPKGNLFGAGDLLFAACAANSPVAAFYVGKLEHDLGDIEVFDLESGAEIPGFNGLSDAREPAGLAVSPGGSSIAVVNEDAPPIPGKSPPDMDDDTVTVIDVANHRITQQFYVGKEAQLDDDPVAFAGDRALVLELNVFKPFKPGSHQLIGTDNIERSIHFFDTATGSEIGSISLPELNSFRFRGVSADGQVVLTLQEKWRYCIFCSRLSDEHVGMVARFVLWNRNTGKPIWQSPPLRLAHHPCSWFTIGSCTPSDEAPDIALDQSGNAVIASWATGAQPISVFTLRTD
jgi:DNA-binding beta-propeller fold protein YncE